MLWLYLVIDSIPVVVLVTFKGVVTICAVPDTAIYSSVSNGLESAIAPQNLDAATAPL